MKVSNRRAKSKIFLNSGGKELFSQDKSHHIENLIDKSLDSTIKYPKYSNFDISSGKEPEQRRLSEGERP